MLNCIRSKCWQFRTADERATRPAWLVRHLDQCPACREQLAAQARLAGLLSIPTPLTAPPPWLAGRITSAARRSKSGSGVAGRAWSRRQVVGVATVALAVLGGVGWLAFLPSGPRPGRLLPGADPLLTINQAFSIPIPRQLVAVAGDLRNPLEVELRLLASDASGAWHALKTDLFVGQP